MFGHFKISPIFWFESSERIIDTRSNFLTRIRSGLAGGTFPEYFGSLFYYGTMDALLLFITGLTTDSLVTFNIKTCQIWLCWEWMGQSVFTVCVSKLEKRIEILQHFRKNPESLNITWLYNELQTKSLSPSYQSTIIIINYWWEASRFLGNFFLYIIRIFCFSELWNVTRYVMNNFIWQKPISPTET